MAIFCFQTSRFRFLSPCPSGVPLPLDGERPKGKGLARAKHDDFEALLIFMCCTNPFELVELLLHAIEGSYVLWVIPEPINLNPEPSIRSYYMTTEEI